MRWWHKAACLSAVAGLLTLGSWAPSARSQSSGAEAADTASAADDGDEEAARLEAIGALSSVNAQHTYLLIGVISDAHVKGAYQSRQVRTLMKGIIQQTESLSRMLRKLETSLSEEDGEFIEQLVEVHTLLQEQARALSAFVADPVEEKAEQFEAARQATLKALDAMLGTGTATDAQQLDADAVPDDKSPPADRDASDDADQQ